MSAYLDLTKRDRKQTLAKKAPMTASDPDRTYNAGNAEVQCAGRSGLVQSQLLLTQHFRAGAISGVFQQSSFRESSRWELQGRGGGKRRRALFGLSKHLGS